MGRVLLASGRYSITQKKHRSYVISKSQPDLQQNYTTIAPVMDRNLEEIDDKKRLACVDHNPDLFI
jgi:hypothetical protein